MKLLKIIPKFEGTTILIRLLVKAATVGCLISGCTLQPQQDLLTPGVTIPEQWQQESNIHLLDTIITAPELHKLIQEALENNRDLQSAAHQFNAFREQVTIAGGPRLPSLDLALDQSRANREQRTLDSASGYAAISWEIDLWGRLANSSAAALYSAEQQQQNYRHAALSLSANVARTWLDAVEAKRQWELALDREKSLVNSLDVIEDGFQRGIRGALDVYSARAELATGRAVTVNRERVFREQLRLLAILVGRYPNAILEVPAQLPLEPPPLPDQLTLNLLERRPDIQASARAVFSRQAQLGVAKTNRLPRLSLSGRYGANDEKLSQALKGDQFFWNAIGGLTIPLFKGGQLAAEQRRQQALLQASIADYRQTLLNALRETEQSIDNETMLTLQLKTSRQAVAISEQAQNQAFERYISGLENLNTWLQAQRTYFSRRSEMMQLETRRLKNRIDLHLALGGDFTG